MTPDRKSSHFTNAAARSRVGPPLIGALLRFPHEVVRQRMLDALHAGGFGDLAMAHLGVLQYPGPDGQRPSELAAQLGMSKQAVNYLLGELEEGGYVERRPHPEDRRSRRIHVTERGRAVAAVIRAAVSEVEREWSTILGEERFAQLRALLIELNERL
jgi:DNA-binding MarR family transcriptional regulator